MKIKGISQARQHMHDRLRAFRGWDTYNELGRLTSRAIEMNFSAGGRPKWKERKYYYSHPILDKTGTMRDAAEFSALKWEHRGDTHVNRVTGPFYGIFHQYGTKRLPERKFADFLPKEVKAMLQIFRDAFLRR